MPTDLDLERDVADALARWLGAEPACTCPDVDPWACPSHDWPAGREGAS